jgi:hypothetical protein
MDTRLISLLYHEMDPRYPDPTNPPSPDYAGGFFMHKEWVPFLGAIALPPNGMFSSFVIGREFGDFKDDVLTLVKEGTLTKEGQSLLYVACRFHPRAAIDMIVQVKQGYPAFNLNKIKNTDGDTPQHGFGWRFEGDRKELGPWDTLLFFLMWYLGADFSQQNNKKESANTWLRKPFSEVDDLFDIELTRPLTTYLAAVVLGQGNHMTKAAYTKLTTLLPADPVGLLSMKPGDFRDVILFTQDPVVHSKRDFGSLYQVVRNETLTVQQMKRLITQHNQHFIIPNSGSKDVLRSGVKQFFGMYPLSP